MVKGKTSLKNRRKQTIKYLIFSLVLMCIYFVMQIGARTVVSAADTAGHSFEIYESNYKGNNGSNTNKTSGFNVNGNEAIHVCKNGDTDTTCDKFLASGVSDNFGSGWYVQSDGKADSNAVSLKLVIKTSMSTVNGLVVFESGYSGSAGANASYDSYKKTNNVWGPVSGTGLKTGSFVAPTGTPSTCAAFDLDAASMSTLKVKGGTIYSMMCITEKAPDTAAGETLTTITINYVYTIRSTDYEEKVLNFALYDDDPYDYVTGGWKEPVTANVYDVRFTASKTINSFRPDSGSNDYDDFVWIGKETTDTESMTCEGLSDFTDTSGISLKPICIKYVNLEESSYVNGERTLTVYLPQEVSYLHKVPTPDPDDDPTIADVKGSSIYGINTFTNIGSESGMNVKYYYWEFTSPSNNAVSPLDGYTITLKVDATGSYVFYIEDLFENVFTSEAIVVEDVQNVQIIVDFITEDKLNIMNSACSYSAANPADDDVWKTAWSCAVSTPLVINFEKMVQGNTDIELEVYQKVVINNGVYEGDSTNVEDVAKQGLGFGDGSLATNLNEIVEVDVWRVTNPSYDSAVTGYDDKNYNSTLNVLSCDTVAATTCNSYFSAGQTGVGRNNKMTFNVVNNGRYRIMIKDKYTNTTNDPIGSAAEKAVLKNPDIEVSIIDRTNPIITSGLSANASASATSIETYAYVIGGGEKNLEVPNAYASLIEKYYEEDEDYIVAYYNAAGTKIFNYQDALEIAKIKIVDPVLYYNVGATTPSVDTKFNGTTAATGYNVYLDAVESGNEGKYIDPSVDRVSGGWTTNRNATGTTGYNLHDYIITSNITSFSGGLVNIIKSTSYTNSFNATSRNTNDYIAIDTTQTGVSDDVNFVNSTGTFLGYLQIVFKDINNNEICKLIESNANTVNASCLTKINKMIDDVEDFKMEFTGFDYNKNSAKRNTSNTYTVTVNVIDTTNPGIDMTGVGTDVIEYTNTTTDCRLEIGNNIQNKEILLGCYKLLNGTTYKVKDNNLHSQGTGYSDAAFNSKGDQYYSKGDTDSDGALDDALDASHADHYYQKIRIFVEEEDADRNKHWYEVVGDPAQLLNKSGDHKLKIVISDHWKNFISSYSTYDSRTDNASTSDRDERNNNLVIYVNYYVNPRTLLIEPLVSDKMYGEADPTFDYCVYVNSNNDTFNLESSLFDVAFIDTYFTKIYCTKNVYEEITTSKKYKATENAKTGSIPYDYYTYTQDSNGAYLLVNNTYVKIIDSGADTNVYYGGYKQSNSGEFFKSGTTYYPILSGYKYEDSSCTKAYMGSGDFYIRTTACEKVTDANRYTMAYTKITAALDTTNIDYITDGTNKIQYLKYNLNDATGNANAALVNNNEFKGALTRVESYCYNRYDATYPIRYGATQDDDGLKFEDRLACAEIQKDANAFRNDNVGQYNITLGTISIDPSKGICVNCNEDYVIQINTKYLASNKQISNAVQNPPNTDASNKLIDDTVDVESAVKFTIRQAVLTISANGSTKVFGEQDPYSNVWNNVTTPVNHASTGYLGGYTIHGWRNGDGVGGNDELSVTNYIVNGFLRREVGEEVGIYDICNVNGNPKTLTVTDTANKCSAEPGKPENYDSTYSYYFAAYDLYKVDGTTSVSYSGKTLEAALTIRDNATIYGNDTGRKLNTTTRNYAILFVKNTMTITANELIIQPGINQGKEYAKTEYHDPLWEFVVYGETISYESSAWNSNVKVSADNSTFTGYTAAIDVENNQKTRVLGLSPYYSGDTEIYYSRREVSPDETYHYTENVTYTANDRYKYDSTNKFYYKDASGTYIYAYGNYHLISDPSSTGVTKVTVVGRLVNQTYSLFDDDFKSVRSDVRENGGNVGWYTFNKIENYRTYGSPLQTGYTLKSVVARTGDNNASKGKCAITIDHTDGSGNPVEGAVAINSSSSVDCRNYNVNYIDNAPKYDENDEIYTTAKGGTEVYKPDGVNACTDDTKYSKACDEADKLKITFEIFKREIILEFIDDNYNFIYGQRYDYYDGGIADASSYKYNKNLNGKFYIKDASSEGDIFLCYSDLGDYLVDCTGNDDYGLTAGDSWTSIGLKFYLHSVVSGFGSGYYTTGTNKAVPAGTYYVYAAIGQLTLDSSNPALDTASEVTAANEEILNNYKFTYKGGSLTVSPKVTSVQLTGYTMEYGESKYYSYGTGSKYSDYTVYSTQCMTDSSFASGTDLITDCSSVDGTGKTDNVVGNTYGFVIEGLDDKDSIVTNFTGRPKRTAKSGSNVGLFDDVGYYAIGVNNIKTVKDTRVVENTSFKECSTNVKADGTFDTTCAFVDDGVDDLINGTNYDISYSLSNNEGAYLFITPAKLDITVYADQTKMYGCAYYKFVTDPSTYYAGYTYESGYTTTNCSNSTSYALDLAYKYKVVGDKDVNVTYDVTASSTDGTQVNTQNGTAVKAGQDIDLTKIVLTNTRLYRVLKKADNTYDYDEIRAYDQTKKYQGQSVGVYTITLGNLDVANNVNTAMCDAYNNPVLNGGSNCQNYNINYYGNSTTTNIEDHKYTNQTTDANDVSVDDLALYTLNYTVDATNGRYIYVNGKYVQLSSSDITNSKVLVNSYVKVSTLTRYSKVSEYIEIPESECTNGDTCYIKLNGNYVTISSVASSRYPSFTGGTQSSSGAYLKVGDKHIKLSTITKFAKAEPVEAGKLYVEETGGDYVKINNEYVQLSSLKRYKASGSDFVLDQSTADADAYVLIYTERALGQFTRYSLSTSGASMYVLNKNANKSTDNVYVFIDGSFVPYDSLTIDANNKVKVNMARIWENSDKTSAIDYRGSITTDTDFTITARIVYVHTEYNVKPYGDADPKEYITCAEIEDAYLTDDNKKDGRTYCTDYTSGKIEMGVSMYYAIQNSLAKSPWTAWTDIDTYNTAAAGYVAYSKYSDIQFDVLTGELGRLIKLTEKTDIAGKYTFDFADVTNVGTLNGKNYMIVHLTNHSMADTKVETESGKVALDTLIYESCTHGSDYCANGKKVKNNTFKLNVDGNGKVVSTGGTSKSISLIDKYDSSNNLIQFWYLGFYKNDKVGTDRAGEITKWWVDRTPFATPYDTLKNNSTPASAIINSVTYTINGGVVLNGSDVQVGTYNATDKKIVISGQTYTVISDKIYDSDNHLVGTYSNQSSSTVNHIEDKYFVQNKEVYFEIIRRTIYLYAVDAEKTYGDSDNYQDLLVAICANDLGYVVDGTGVKCASTTAAYAYGLSESDKTIFLDGGYMRQDKIKNNGNSGNYIFQGETHKTDSFGIYFRRENNENAGYYTLTACAAQSDISDCTNKNLKEIEGTPIQVLGDNYKIIEVSGVFTIKPREVNITPNGNQGFEYGNYTDNGTMPNITFTEKRADKTTENGLVYGSGVYLFKASDHSEVAEITTVNASGYLVNEFTISSVTYYIDGLDVFKKGDNTLVARISVTESDGKNTKTVTINSVAYNIIQKAKCLINVSGLYTVCINDAQNEALTNGLESTYYEYAVTYPTEALNKQIKVANIANPTTNAHYTLTKVNEITANTTGKTYYSYDVYNDSYSNPKNLYTRTETTTTGSRKALSMKCGTNEDVRYSRDVCAYDITIGDLAISDNVKKTHSFYVEIIPSKRYTRSGTEGSYIYTQSNSGTFLKYATDKYVEIVTAEAGRNTYVLGTDDDPNEYELSSEGNYVLVTETTYNYKMGSFDGSKKFTVTAAGLKVTPIEKQYKIYGAADPEIRFTVETTFTVADTHYQKWDSNIVKLCNGATCYTTDQINAYKYTANGGTQSNTGTYILLTSGWTVTLDSYAYNENSGVSGLDYGRNLTSVKYTMDTTVTPNVLKNQKLDQSAGTSVKHYDKYTAYNTSINTDRILIGNLYVENNAQSVGEKKIVNGMKVGVNNLYAVNGNATNYTLSFDSTKLFIIIPRPVNVEIVNIVKTYGQATDRLSCDVSAYECIVGDGILMENGSGANQDDNDSLLINNFNIRTDAVAGTTLNSANVSGITIVYGSEINMPTAVSVTFADTNEYKNYVTVTLGKFYTDTYDTDGTTGIQERKNDTLNIKVERENYNIARATSTCLISGEDFCEDVGEYFLTFNHRSSTAKTKEATIVSGYYDKYWGYNPNYYVIIYNNFKASGWSTYETDTQGYKSITANRTLYYSNVIDESSLKYGSEGSATYTANTVPGPSSTLRITKRTVEVVVETISNYSYTEFTTADGSLANVNNKYLRTGTTEATYKYHLITSTNRYIKKNILVTGMAAAADKYVQSATGNYLCEYVKDDKNVDTNCHEIITDAAASGKNVFTRSATMVGERFSIEQNMDVPKLPTISNYTNGSTTYKHHTTYDTTNHLGYITWYEQPRQVRVSDALTGNVAYCTKTFNLDPLTLDTLRSQACDATSNLRYYYGTINPNDRSNAATYFDTNVNGHYIITREKDKLYIGNTGITSGAYEANNYTTTFVNGILQIDIDETPPVVNVGSEFIIKEANDGKMSMNENGSVLAFLEATAIRNNYCADLTSSRDSDNDVISCKDASNNPIVFTYEKDSLNTGTPTISWSNITTILDWFDIKSYEPSIMRAGIAVEKRYDPRWYITIQNDFDQKKTGDYTIFIYVQDNAGNISLATTVTLRIVDTTAPEVGTMNLYDAKVKCKDGSDCSKEENWEVAEDIYLPILTFTTERLGYVSSTDKQTKYSYTYSSTTPAGWKYVENQYFGTYYKISAGTDARAVKHTGWTNAEDGIWMTVLGGDDNSLSYLNTDRYAKKYTVDGDGNFVEGSTGTSLLLGSLIKLSNLTKYRQVVLGGDGTGTKIPATGANAGQQTSFNHNGNEGGTGTTKTVYIPDVNGKYIRYKGAFYDVSTTTTLKLFKYDSANSKYTKATSAVYDEDDKRYEADYYICDGEFYTIPSEKYTPYTDTADGNKIKYKHDAAGKYINFAQWDSYYTRDGGYSWLKYSRDNTTGYLVLNQDGQRLIMIKAIDNGYTYNNVETTKTFVYETYLEKDKNATCINEDCTLWYNVVINKGYDITVGTGDIVATISSDGKYDVYNGTKVEKYNISEWAPYSASGNRDMKFAYLDTIIPLVNLDNNQHLEVYEYGCSDISKCNNNHSEQFGTVTDSYVYPLDKLVKYDASGNALTFDATIVNGTTQVMVNGNKITITTDNRLVKNSGTDLKECIGVASECLYTKSDAGTYIYLGRVETAITADAITDKVSDRITGTTNFTDTDGVTKKLQVYNEHAAAVHTVTVPTAGSASATDANLQKNTWFEESGVGTGLTNVVAPATPTLTTFGGTGNTAVDFGTGSAVNDNFVTVFVYATVAGGTAAVLNNPYYNAIGYYKFMMKQDSTSGKYNVLRCNASTIFAEAGWCDSPASIGEFTDMAAAMNAVLAVYKEGTGGANVYDFKGNDITFTIDYRVADLAGNISMYERKGILISSFTRTIMVVDPATQALSNRVELEVGQNEDITELLSNFSVGTSTGAALRSTERILQTIYYNGEIVSEREKYDLSALSSIDTATPGEYRIVYSIERKDGTVYVQGNEVELLVTVKPSVATVENNKIDFLMISMIAIGLIAIGTIGFIYIPKRKKD